MMEDGEVITIGDIALRRYRDEDVKDIVENIDDEAISRFTLNIPYPYGPKDAEDYLDKNDSWYRKGTSLNLAITFKGQDKVIGGIGLMNIEEKFHHAEIGYWIGRKYWGEGIVSRCVHAMVRFGFERLGLQRISAVIFSPNKASQRVLIKNGFLHEGTMKDRYVLDGRPVDGEMFGLTRKTYDKHMKDLANN